MKILIYGDSNTWGYVPNINGYSKNAVTKQYPLEQIWWYPLVNKCDVTVNGLCGRAINNDNPWLLGRNATKTIDADLTGIVTEIVIVELGTNDCKSKYNLSAKEITQQLENLVHKIKQKTNANIMIISPPKIKEGNAITDKYYIGAENKTLELDCLFKDMAQRNGFLFVSGVNLSVGEDGEHLTKEGHLQLRERVEYALKNIVTI